MLPIKARHCSSRLAAEPERRAADARRPPLRLPPLRLRQATPPVPFMTASSPSLEDTQLPRVRPGARSRFVCPCWRCPWRKAGAPDPPRTLAAHPKPARASLPSSPPWPAPGLSGVSHPMGADARELGGKAGSAAGSDGCSVQKRCPTDIAFSCRVYPPHVRVHTPTSPHQDASTETTDKH